MRVCTGKGKVLILVKKNLKLRRNKNYVFTGGKKDMSKRETVIELGNLVKIYKMYNVSDNVNEEGISFNKKGEPVGGEFICELNDCEGRWKDIREVIELEINESSLLPEGSLYYNNESIIVSFNNVLKENAVKLSKAFPQNYELDNYSILILLEKGKFDTQPYCIIYKPFISLTKSYIIHSSGETLYSIVINSLASLDREKGDQLGFFYIHINIDKKEKCKYCESENTRKLDEKYHKDLKADYCCEECGEYFSNEKEENKFNRINKSNFREAVDSIPEIKTYKEAMNILYMTSLWLENSEIRETEKNIKKQWKRIYNKRLQESLNYIKENYRYSEDTEDLQYLYKKRVEKAWLHYINYVMNSQHSVSVKDVKIEIE